VSSTAPSSTTSGVLTDAKAKAAKQDEAYFEKLTTAIFILITLLFPVIGGVCLSLGIGNIHNRRELAYTEKHHAARSKEYLDALAEFKKVAENKNICEENLERCNSTFVKDFTGFFFCCYLHGYERGVVEPDKSLDFYERVQKLRDRLISTKSYDAVQRNIRPYPQINLTNG